MFPESSAVFPLLMSLAAVSAAQSSMPSGSDSLPIQVDLYEDVVYSPPDAWHSGSNATCGLGTAVDHYTAEVNATATFNFVGNAVMVSGVHTNNSGALGIQLDDHPLVSANLWTPTVRCGPLFFRTILNGSHTLTLTLLSSEAYENTTIEGVRQGVIETPMLHLTSIVYGKPQPASASATSTSSDSEALATGHKNTTAIVAGTICGAFGFIALVVGILFFWKRRRAHKSRHAFNPNNTSQTTEVSPETATAPMEKFGAYVRFDDDVKTKSVENKLVGLVVPELHYTKSGLRSRSPSPLP